MAPQPLNGNAIGKKVRGSLYLHRSALRGLDGVTADRLARVSFPVGLDWNVVRIAPDHLGLQVYEDFAGAAFPALLESCRIDGDGRTSRRDYRKSANPLILHRKELTVPMDTPGRNIWASMTEGLVALGLFNEVHLIGRRLPWEERLARQGIRIVDHAICPISR